MCVSFTAISFWSFPTVLWFVSESKKVFWFAVVSFCCFVFCVDFIGIVMVSLDSVLVLLQHGLLWPRWMNSNATINAKHAACKYSVWIDLAKAKRRRKWTNSRAVCMGSISHWEKAPRGPICSENLYATDRTIDLRKWKPFPIHMNPTLPAKEFAMFLQRLSIRSTTTVPDAHWKSGLPPRRLLAMHVWKDWFRASYQWLCIPSESTKPIHPCQELVEMPHCVGHVHPEVNLQGAIGLWYGNRILSNKLDGRVLFE